MSRSLRSLVPAALLAAALTVAQAGTAQAPAAEARVGEGPVTIGSVASLSGGAAAYGRDQARGTRLAVSLLNGRAGAARLRLLGADDRSDGAAARTALRRLIGAGAGAIVGPTLSPVAEAADPVATRAGVPVLGATNATLDITGLPNVWRVSLSEQAMIPRALAAVRGQRGVRRAALLIDSGDGYARGAGEVFVSAARAAGIRLTGVARFDSAAGSLERAVAALRAGGSPQALLVATRSDAAVAALKAIRAADPQIQVVGGNGFNAEDVIAAAGAAADGLIVAASWNRAIVHPGSRAFVRAFRQRFGAEPSAFAAQGYAGVEIAAAAARAGGGSSPARVRAGLSRLGTVDTVLGPLRFNRSREARYPAAVQVVRGGHFGLLAQRGSIRGSWSGLLHQSGMRPFRVWATIAAPGGSANTVRYSGLDCRGRWTALGRRAGVYRFTEVITAGASDACKGRGIVRLTPTADPNALRYVFNGGGVSSRGVLRRL